MSMFHKVVLYTDTDGRARFRDDSVPLTEGKPEARLSPLMPSGGYQLRHSPVGFRSTFHCTPQPQWVFIQAGYRNRYQHPAPVVMARYKALGLPTKATASCGAIRWHSTDAAPSCYREQVRHHWHWQAPPFTMPATPAQASQALPEAEDADF